MANKVTVSESAIRELIREALDNKELAKTVMDPFALTTQVNPVVSPAAPYDSPLNPDFIPQDKPEFIVALQRAVKDIDDQSIPSLYKSIIDALEEFGVDPETRIPQDIENEKEEKRKAALGGGRKEKNMGPRTDTKEEAMIRSLIKNFVNEARRGSKFLPDEEDDPQPDMADPAYAAWEERQEERDKRSEFAKRGQHEKNITSDVPATSVSKALDMKHATYVKGEQQVLNKMISRLLDPKSTKSQKSSMMDSYVRTTFNDWISALADTFSEMDPEIDDPAIEKFFLNLHDPDYQSMLYDSPEFQKYFNETVHEDTEEAIASGSDPREAKKIEKELLALYSSLGHGYGRLDQDPASFSRLKGLFSRQLSDEEDLPDEEPVAPVARSGGRKKQAGRSIGKPELARRPRR